MYPANLNYFKGFFIPGYSGFFFTLYLSLPMKDHVSFDPIIHERSHHVVENTEQSWIVANMNLANPDREGTRHEGGHAANLLHSDISKKETMDIICHRCLF